MTNLAGFTLRQLRTRGPIRTTTLKKSFYRNMHIVPIQMRWGQGDNYAYVVIDETSKEAALIDPAEPSEVIPEVEKLMLDDERIKLTSIINTHHHYDHAGGNKQLLQHYELTTCIGGKDCPYKTETPEHGEKFDIGIDIEVEALHTPCHTQDSICYYMIDKKTQQRAVFTGDTLFIAGCGRFFEGTPEQMAVALTEVLAKLPDSTRVYPGHEYTKSNVRFVKTILPNNEYVQSLSEFCDENEETCGQFTIGDEKKHNPFMMIDDKEVQRAINVQERVNVMATLRNLKNKM